MTSTLGPPKTVVNANQLRSTNVYGNFYVMDNSSSSIPARAGFGRDVYINGNLFLGNGAVDASGYFLNSSSNIEFPFNKTLVAVPVTCLNYIRNLTSDVQQQILDISGNASATSKSFIDISFTGSINSIGKGTLDYIKTLTSDVQTQINNSNTNISTIEYRTRDISWIPGTINRTNIQNACSTGILSFSQSLNNISTTTFGFLSGVTSSIQNQINNSNTNISTVEYRTRDISWTYGTSNVTTIGNFCNTNILSFSQSLNNISTTTFSYLSGVTSNIQQQINNIGGNPTGAVVAFAGTSSSLNGYLLCDGSYYSITQYAALYNVIGTTYGSQAGTFRVPNYQAVFLRGAGTQFVAQPVIGGGGGGAGAPVGKTYTAPSIGTTLCDQSIQTTVNTLTPNIQVKTFVTGGTAMFAPSYTFQYSNAVSSLSFDSTLDYTNYGNDNTFPAHTSVQYFIKY